jgi:hypothetical protein
MCIRKPRVADDAILPTLFRSELADLTDKMHGALAHEVFPDSCEKFQKAIRRK